MLLKLTYVTHTCMYTNCTHTLAQRDTHADAFISNTNVSIWANCLVLVHLQVMNNLLNFFCKRRFQFTEVVLLNSHSFSIHIVLPLSDLTELICKVLVDAILLFLMLMNSSSVGPQFLLRLPAILKKQLLRSLCCPDHVESGLLL
jgi:hypothetical protein